MGWEKASNTPRIRAACTSGGTGGNTGSRESASRLYLQLNTAGMGKRQNSAPKSVPDAELEFGNGCILRLWEQDVWDGYNREWVPGVFVWCQGADGTNYMYDTDQVRWQVLGKWVPGE